MRASPPKMFYGPPMGDKVSPQWITPCYNGVGVGVGWLGGLLAWGARQSEFWAGWLVGVWLTPLKCGLASIFRFASLLPLVWRRQQARHPNLMPASHNNASSEKTLAVIISNIEATQPPWICFFWFASYSPRIKVTAQSAEPSALSQISTPAQTLQHSLPLTSPSHQVANIPERPDVHPQWLWLQHLSGSQK